MHTNAATNQDKQGRTRQALVPRDAALLLWVMAGGCQLLLGARGARPYLHQHPSNSSHRTHREKVSFHVKQRNGKNSSIPGKSKVRAAREKLNWKLLTLAAALLLTRDEGRAGQGRIPSMVGSEGTDRPTSQRTNHTCLQQKP